jgi:hypothetical protein
MRDNAREILNRARATVERITAAEQHYSADARQVRFWNLPESQTRPQAQEEAQEMTERTWEAWHQWARGIAADVCGELADEIVDDLKREVKALREELAELKADIAVERSVRNGTIIDLPDWRRKSNAS